MEMKIDISSLKATELKLPVIPSVSSGEIDSLLEYKWCGNCKM